MSSVNDVMVSSCAIFGSLTNVPGRRAVARGSPRARGRRERRERVSRETPKSALSCRSDGIASPTRELLDEVEHEIARLACFVTRSIVTDLLELVNTRSTSASLSEQRGSASGSRALGAQERSRRSRRRRSGSAPGRPRGAGGPPTRACVRGSTRAFRSAPRSVDEVGAVVVLVLERAPRLIALRVDAEEHVRVRAELLEHDDLDLDRRAARRTRTPRPRSVSGRMPSTTRSRRALSRPTLRVERHAELRRTRTSSPSMLRLDEVHRR